MLHDLRHDLAGKADRHCKPDSLVSAVVRQDRRVNADEFAARVDEGAAGIARINGGVGLDEVFIVFDPKIVAPLRADDAHRHSLAQAERASHREN